MSGSDIEVSQLAAQVREWRSPIAATDAAPFRLCFRLDEPAEDARAQTWHVRYLLQAHDDPSLQLPAADVWAGKSRMVRTDPKPILLAGLGQAANLSPDVEASLKAAAPTGFTTTTVGAHRFLNETAWLLEQAGFGVLLPAWWDRARHQTETRSHREGEKSADVRRQRAFARRPHRVPVGGCHRRRRVDARRVGAAREAEGPARAPSREVGAGERGRYSRRHRVAPEEAREVNPCGSATSTRSPVRRQ